MKIRGPFHAGVCPIWRRLVLIPLLIAMPSVASAGLAEQDEPWAYGQ